MGASQAWYSEHGERYREAAIFPDLECHSLPADYASNGACHTQRGGTGADCLLSLGEMVPRRGSPLAGGAASMAWWKPAVPPGS